DRLRVQPLPVHPPQEPVVRVHPRRRRVLHRGLAVDSAEEDEAVEPLEAPIDRAVAGKPVEELRTRSPVAVAAGFVWGIDQAAAAARGAAPRGLPAPQSSRPAPRAGPDRGGSLPAPGGPLSSPRPAPPARHPGRAAPPPAGRSGPAVGAGCPSRPPGSGGSSG